MVQLLSITAIVIVAYPIFSLMTFGLAIVAAGVFASFVGFHFAVSRLSFGQYSAIIVWNIYTEL